MRGTTPQSKAQSLEAIFQSTSPVRGTTLFVGACRKSFIISIHVPRAGDDEDDAKNVETGKAFQSTSPVRGTTWLYRVRFSVPSEFQSTSPVRGTTALLVPHCGRDEISIHVPRAGDDGHEQHGRDDAGISIHVPRAGDDNKFHVR